MVTLKERHRLIKYYSGYAGIATSTILANDLLQLRLSSDETIFGTHKEDTLAVVGLGKFLLDELITHKAFSFNRNNIINIVYQDDAETMSYRHSHDYLSVIADPELLPLKPNSIDYILLIHSVLASNQELPNIIKSAWRALKDDAQIIIIALNQLSPLYLLPNQSMPPDIAQLPQQLKNTIPELMFQNIELNYLMNKFTNGLGKSALYTKLFNLTNITVGKNLSGFACVTAHKTTLATTTIESKKRVKFSYETQKL